MITSGPHFGRKFEKSNKDSIQYHRAIEKTCVWKFHIVFPRRLTEFFQIFLQDGWLESNATARRTVLLKDPIQDWILLGGTQTSTATTIHALRALFTCDTKMDRAFDVTRRGHKRGVGPLVRDGCLSYTTKEMSFLFIFSVLTIMIGPTFSRSKNSKKVTCNHPGFSSRKKWRLGPSFQTDSTKNFEVMLFCMPQQKRGTLDFLFFAVRLGAREIPGRPEKNTVFWDGMDLGRWWVYVRFLWHRYGQSETENLEGYVVCKVLKKISFKIFGGAVLGART